MEDLKKLCLLAISNAAQDVFVSEQAHNRFIDSLLKYFAPTNSNAFKSDDNFKSMISLNAITNDKSTVSPIWRNEDFLFPAVVGLALFFDSMLSPNPNKQIIHASIEANPDSLCKYKITELHIGNDLNWTNEETRVCYIISSAAFNVLTDAQYFGVGLWYLGVLHHNQNAVISQ